MSLIDLKTAPVVRSDFEVAIEATGKIINNPNSETSKRRSPSSSYQRATSYFLEGPTKIRFEP
jgi:hypothetical protein